MNIAEFSIDKKVITYVLTFLITVGGIISYQQLGRLEDPEFTIKQAKIYTRYPGASAQEVEEQVTDVLERAAQQMGQLKHVTSRSEPGFSNIEVEMKDKYDKNSLPQVWDELRRKINDAQKDLPQGAGPSLVNDDYGDVYGVYFAVYGDGYSYAELKDYVDILRRELLLVQDVGKISLYGNQQEAIYVEISRNRQAQLEISTDLIVNSLRGQNQSVFAGKVEVGEKYIRINPSGALDSVKDISDILILQSDGTPSKLRIRDIATVRRGYADPPNSLMSYNGHRAIGMGISTVEGGNVVTMGSGLKVRLRELSEQIPVGIEYGPIAIQSDAVVTAINGFMINLTEAVLIVIAVLIFSMGLRCGLLIGGILILTVLATFIPMNSQGIMLQRISLGALIIALGMLVDNAIVVVEGIVVNAKQGMSKTKAASKIVQQTMWPLFGATVIAILAFSAIGVSQDSTGEYCRSLFQVIFISLTFSWLLAITVTPLFGVMFLKIEKDDPDKDPYEGKFYQGYKNFLISCVRHRWITMIVLIVALIGSLFAFKHVKMSFFPPATRPQFMVHFWLPQGTHIWETEKHLSQLEKFVLKQENTKDVCGIVGNGGLRFMLTYTPEDLNAAYGMLLVTVKDSKKIEELRTIIQKQIDENFPTALGYTRKFVLGPGKAQKIQPRFRGPDHNMLRKIVAEIKPIIVNQTHPKAVDIVDNWRSRVPLVRPIVAESAARNAGITRAQIADAIQQTFSGKGVSQYRERDKILPIILESPEKERGSIDELHNIQIWSPVAGKSIPLSQVVIGFETVSENTLIQRRNRLPTLTIKCDPKVGKEATPVLDKLRPKVEGRFDELIKEWNLAGYSLEWGGEYEDSKNASSALMGKLPVTAVLMFLILIFLFNSLKKSSIIFLTIPFCIVGVTWGLLLTNKPFGFMALLGLLSLVGMLIKNAIVLMDEINLQLSEGKKPFDAVINAGVSRLRPVSNAALTTVLGVITLAVDAFFGSMAITIMFGLTFATVLTLVMIPVLFAIFFNVSEDDG